MNSFNYIIITPTRNEASYFSETVRSIINQTIRPLVWVIVDDGSTDITGEIADAAAQAHSWIRVVHRKDRGFRKQGGGVIEAFYEGYEKIRTEPWDFIVKLDGDLSFGEEYFEMILKRFDEIPRLGIGSGIYCELKDKSTWKNIVMPQYHAAGCCKVLRRQCFEQISGFIPSRGWDTVDEIRAMHNGWMTGHFTDLKMKHLKPEGSGIGTLRTSSMHGEIYYLTGGSKVFFMLKVIHRFKSRPFVIGAVALAWGYLKTMLTRHDLLVTKDEARCYKRLLRSRILQNIKSSTAVSN